MTYLSSYKHFETGSINVARAGIESKRDRDRSRAKEKEGNSHKCLDNILTDY